MVSFSTCIKAACLLALAATPFTHSLKGTCHFGVLPRKEWRTLSRQEKVDFLAAMNQVMVRAEGRPAFYDTLVNTHMTYNNYIHGNPMFFPWHRYFLYTLEQELQRASGKPITIPYWSWGYDSQAPELAPVWGNDELTFGVNGGGGEECVTTGAFANRRGIYPNDHCLQREWSDGDKIGALTPLDGLNGIIARSGNYDQIRKGIEFTPHGTVHVNIGGDMAYMHSPNDPIFFLHHSNVDKIWNDWQKAHPNLANTYGGDQSEFSQSGNRGRTRAARTTDKMYPYTEAIVSDAFDTRNLCSFYEDMKLSDVQNDLPEPTITSPAPQIVARPPTPAPAPAPPPADDHKKHGFRHFFERIFSEGEKDPSQAPLGSNSVPAPFDKSIKISPPKADAPIPANDRTELTKLRTPNPLPESWITMNSLPKEEVRQHETAMSKAISDLNKITGFISPSALWHHAEKVGALVKQGVHEFHADVRDARITIKNDLMEKVGHGLQFFSNVKAKILLSLGIEHVHGDARELAPKVEKVVGPPQHEGGSVSNPLPH